MSKNTFSACCGALEMMSSGHPAADGALQVLQRAPGLVTLLSLAQEFIRLTQGKPEIQAFSQRLGCSLQEKHNHLRAAQPQTTPANIWAVKPKQCNLRCQEK